MDFPVSTNIASHQSVNLMTQQSSQSTRVQSENQMRNGGILLLLLLIACICIRRWYQKQPEQQADTYRRQQIESLERIWRMSPYREPEGDSKRG